MRSPGQLEQPGSDNSGAPMSTFRGQAPPLPFGQAPSPATNPAATVPRTGEEGAMAADRDALAQAGLIYELSEGVAWLRLNRPDRRNAMDHYPGGQGPHGMGFRDALLEAIRNATEDKAVKVAVITGNGPVFSAGADLKSEAIEIQPEHRRLPTVARDDGLLYGWYRLLESILRSDTPFIAGVTGPPSGAGVSLPWHAI